MAKLASAGVEAVFATFEDSNGFPTGLASLSAPSSGTYVEAGSLVGIQSLDFTVPEAPRATVTGNDRALFQFTFKPTELPSGSMSLGVFDAEVAALAVNQALVTQGFMVGRFVNPDTFTQKNMWIAINAQAKDADPGSYGNSGYEVSWYRVQLTPRGRQGWNYQAEATYLLDMISVPFDTLPWGITVSEASSAAATTADGYDGIFSPYKTTIGHFVGNNSDTTFTLSNAAQDPANYSRAVIVESGTPTVLTYNAGTPGAGEYKIVDTTVTLGDTLVDGDHALVVFGRN